MAKFELVTGAELISRAALDAGVNFFAGYPITPASSVYAAMLKKLQAEGKLAIGTSDEISAISMCIGASIRGAKAMTATAAPGLSLMIENLGYAFTTETPLLIVLGQRLGPSTGAATQSAEGDISFVQSLVSGGFEIPVIAPNSIFNSYQATIQAINISEKYRTPVILLTEKDILMSTTNISIEKLEEIKSQTQIIERQYRELGSELPFKTYNFNQLKEVPEFVAAGVGGEDRVVATASFHDKAGNLSKNSDEAFEVFKHLKAKINDNIDEFSYHEISADQGADTLVISFMASDLSAREAVKTARAHGSKIKHLSLFTIFPVPVQLIKSQLNGIKRVIIPEINYSGQYAEILRPYLIDNQGKLLELIKINSIADLIKPEEILQHL